MSDFSKKVSFAQNLANAVRYLNDSDNESFGWQLPCTVDSVDNTKGIVTVNFSVIGSNGSPLDLPQITIPIMGWKYIRYPIKKGDPGVTISIDTNTRNIAKLSTGISSLIGHGNFGPTLMFIPIAQADWSETDDVDAVVVAAPNGAIIRTDNKDATITVNKDNVIVDYKDGTITLGSTNITLQYKTSANTVILKDGEIDITSPTVKIISSSASVVGNLTVTGSTNLQGSTTIQGKSFLGHTHPVSTAPGTTGGVS